MTCWLDFQLCWTRLGLVHIFETWTSTREPWICPSLLAKRRFLHGKLLSTENLGKFFRLRYSKMTILDFVFVFYLLFCQKFFGTCFSPSGHIPPKRATNHNGSAEEHELSGNELLSFQRSQKCDGFLVSRVFRKSTKLYFLMVALDPIFRDRYRTLGQMVTCFEIDDVCYLSELSLSHNIIWFIKKISDKKFSKEQIKLSLLKNPII